MSPATHTLPTLSLNDGHTIPQLGFGVFQIPAEETAEAVNCSGPVRLHPRVVLPHSRDR
jgi:hypothetical protein